MGWWKGGGEKERSRPCRVRGREVGDMGERVGWIALGENSSI